MSAYPKPRTFRSGRLLEIVNMLGAQNDIPCACGCGIEDGTVVAAHGNYGKGGAIKASDATVIALRFACHSKLDQPGQDARSKPERRAFEAEANLRTLRWLIERGYLVPSR